MVIYGRNVLNGRGGIDKLLHIIYITYNTSILNMCIAPLSPCTCTICAPTGSGIVGTVRYMHQRYLQQVLYM